MGVALLNPFDSGQGVRLRAAPAAVAAASEQLPGDCGLLIAITEPGRWRLTLVHQALDLVVRRETHHGVGHLSEQRSRQSVVQSSNTCLSAMIVGSL